ncbi:MAG: hypothetical protein FVQ83_07205 [Chloroflexi bacterium]|nr:hypothetical protein [Chloroflexota bacterium]
MDEQLLNTITLMSQALHDIRNLLKISTGENVKAFLEKTLVSEQEKLAYELTDGENTQTQIAKKVNVTQPAVSFWWRKWNQINLSIDSPAYPGRQEAVFSLSEYGIKVKNN